jgi:stearoyl-CoA desaturase (delta-9 desaturase)
MASVTERASLAVSNGVTADDVELVPEISAHPVAATAATRELAHPEGTQPPRILWPYLFGITSIHLLALLAFVPWFFSWTGVALAFIGLYAFGTLGINLCYHRLLTHQGFKCPKWLEHSLATLGVCCLQDTPARWVAIHRLHHRHSDEQPDPHSPLVTLLWGHMGWLFLENREVNTVQIYERYARDVLKDPFYFRFERNMFWMTTYALHALAFYLVGSLVGWAWTGSLLGGVQYGLSLLVWGVFVRTVAVWHITWSVNSLTHMWGYRNYATDENSRNNWFVALVSNGEGWHNNHHADQRAAAHGHKWWEFDITWITVRALQLVGLASDVVLPRCWTRPESVPTTGRGASLR